MKLIGILFLIILVWMVLPGASGAISDKTGLKKIFSINADKYNFDVETVANFEINDVKLNKEQKKLTFDITSGLENNFAEIQIPINLIDGNLTVYLNGNEIFPQVRKNDRISFVVLEFNGTGHNVVEAIGTTYLPEFSNLILIAFGIATGTATLFSRKFIF